jgi:glycine cleavage system H lipoate-binding protein
MKSKMSKSKEKKEDRKKKGVDAKRLMSPDLPFDYDEVVSATGPEYASYMNRNGMSFRPYEEVKRSAPGFYLLEDRCIWMKAGIINFRNCDYDNDCYNCPFDQAMRSAMGEKDTPERIEKQANWVIQLQERYQIAAKPCIHFKSGRIESPEECTGNYECYACNIHQMLYAEKQVQTIKKPKYTNVSGFQVADDYYHHLGHSWAHMEHDGRVRVGIDAFISKVFGPTDTINLPPVGAFLKQGEVGWVLTRNGHKAPMQSPLSGTLCAVNNRIKEQPEISNNDPYEEGWLFLLDPANLKLNLKGLYFGKECFEWMEKENQNLLEFLGPKYERLAATGGKPIADIYGHFPEMAWDMLVRTFLHTLEK